MKVCLQGEHEYARCRRVKSFTLIETLVALAVLSIIILILATIIGTLSKAQTYVSGNTSSFRDAELAFQSVTRTVSQATLQTYWDYYPSQSGTNGPPPQTYIRQSNLHFIVGRAKDLEGSASASLNPTLAVFFQAPLGYATNSSYVVTPDVFNACGYFINFTNNASSIPPAPGLVANAQYRFRLMQLAQPTEQLEVYTDTNTAPDSGNSYKWITDPIIAGEVRPVADNIIALVVEPQYSVADQASAGAPLTSNYLYDSRAGTINLTSTPVQPTFQNQLPSMLKITMVAIDEASAIRLANQYGSSPPPLVASTLFTSTATGAPAQYDQDIQTLTTSLTAMHVNYRIFVASVPLRAAKWSTQ
jgi:uncharacterized protein (TIGR02599 family)